LDPNHTYSAVPDPHPIDDDDDMLVVNGGDDPEAVSPKETVKKTKTSVHRQKSKREVSSFSAACHRLAFLSSSVYDDANIEVNCV
jgi:hypothetical protein